MLASGNAGKLLEIVAMLAGLPITVRSKADFAVSSVEETGTTFVENAIIKARHASTLSGQPAIADDSGIEVDALGGAPGVGGHPPETRSLKSCSAMSPGGGPVPAPRLIG